MLLTARAPNRALFNGFAGAAAGKIHTSAANQTKNIKDMSLAELVKWANLTFRLYFGNVGCLGSPVALDNLKLDLLPFVQGFITIHFYGREMDKYVFAPIPFDKTEPFFGIKPFNLAFHAIPP